jgi:hypothetical protein
MKRHLPVLQLVDDGHGEYGPRALSYEQLRSRRPPFARAKTLSISRETKGRRLLLQLTYEQDLEALGGAHPERPKTRGECKGHVGPCGFASCYWHLKYDITDSGSLKDNFPGIEIDQMEHTCALDVADRGGATLQEVGRVLNITRERVRQLETRAFPRLIDSLRAHVDDNDDAPADETIARAITKAIATMLDIPEPAFWEAAE